AGRRDVGVVWGARRRAGVVVDHVEEALVEEGGRDAGASAGEGLLDSQLPAARVLGPQVRVPDRVAGRVVLGEGRLAEPGAGGGADARATPEAVGRPGAIRDIGAKALI